MDFSHMPLLLALPPLVAVSGACSAAETALFSLSYQDRARLRRESAGAAAAAAYLLARPRALLVSLILANTLVNTLYFVLTSIVTFSVENAWLGVGLAVFNLVVLTVMAEVVSKMLATRYPVGFTKLLARPALVLFTSLGPVRQFLEIGVIAPLTRLLTPPTAAAGASLTPEELEGLVRVGERRGDIDADEQRMLRQVIALGDMRVRDVMIPRTQMEWLSEGAGAEEVEGLWRRTGMTRVPLCAGSIDDGVLGMLNVKGYLMALALWRETGSGSRGGEAPRAVDFLEEVKFVPQTATLDRLLEQFRVGATKVGLCVDEHGSVTGVVSAQSVAGPLVAEVAGGLEGVPSEPTVVMVGLGRWQVSGRLSVREWAQMFKLEADPRVSTVAGLIFARLGRVPAVGDRVRLGNVQMEVQAVSGRVAQRVLMSLVPETTATGEGA